MPFWILRSLFLPWKKSTLGFCWLLKRSFSKKMGKTLNSHIIHSLGGEYCWIVWDSEPIRLLKSPRSLSVYILIDLTTLMIVRILGVNHALWYSSLMWFVIYKTFHPNITAFMSDSPTFPTLSCKDLLETHWNAWEMVSFWQQFMHPCSFSDVMRSFSWLEEVFCFFARGN